MILSNQVLISIRKKIINSEFKLNKKFEIFFDSNYKNLDIDQNLLFKQFFYSRLINNEFNKKIIEAEKSKKKLFYPLPKVWSEIIQNEGYKISCINPLSLSILKLKMIIKALKTVLLSFPYKHEQKEDFIYVHNFNLNNSIKNNKFNFFKWILNLINSDTKQVFVNRGSSKIIDEQYKISKKNIFRCESLVFFIKLLKFYFFFILKFFKNDDVICLSNEIIKLEILKNKSFLPKEVFFDHSEAIYKPIWTYYLESLNINCVVFFYSTNSLPIVLKESEAKSIDNFVTHGWELLNWGEYFIWNNYQKKFLDMFIKFQNYKTRITGPIPYESINQKITIKNKNIISVFDVTPFDPTFFSTLGLPYHYYSYEIVKKFYDDICKLKLKNDFQIIFKSKRINSNTDQRYKNYLQDLRKKHDFYDEVSVFELISESKKIICMPFTSPAVIAKEMGKNVIYYDPSENLKFLEKYDVFNHNINIFNNDELQKWVSQ